jgi:formylglycine-generating enzyme required for sulfatase activity
MRAHLLRDRKTSTALSNREAMIWIPGGSFRMGSNDFYREERPVRGETVEGFWIDPYPVTNADFRKFVSATGYVTACERPPDPEMYPDADPSLLLPGSSVFRKPHGPVDLRDNRAWWEYVPGADWQHPQGPGSSIEGRDDHPVVHVAYEDARAYAAWAGKELPVESEWEFAARGGLDGATYAWGETVAPHGRAMANTW